MNLSNILTVLAIALGVAACAAHRPPLDRADYQRGYRSSWEFAKKDSLNANCFRYPHFAKQAAQKKYAAMLQDQGQSESYMKGFYSGYEDNRIEFYDLYCRDGDPRDDWPLSLK